MFLLAASSLLLTGLGAASLVELAASYRQADLTMTETPQTFQAWIADVSSSASVSPAELSASAAHRLLAMPLEKRRGVAVAVMNQKFWLPLAPAGQTPRALQQSLREGVLEALRHAPMAGDLYLAAAWLEIRTLGFGSRARALLKASHTFSPYELPLVVKRLALAPSVWPLLAPDERTRLKTDLDTLRRVAPAQADEIEAALTAEGVSFP